MTGYLYCVDCVGLSLLSNILDGICTTLHVSTSPRCPGLFLVDSYVSNVEHHVIFSPSRYNDTYFENYKSFVILTMLLSARSTQCKIDFNIQADESGFPDTDSSIFHTLFDVLNANFFSMKNASG